MEKSHSSKKIDWSPLFLFNYVGHFPLCVLKEHFFHSLEKGDINMTSSLEGDASAAMLLMQASRSWRPQLANDFARQMSSRLPSPPKALPKYTVVDHRRSVESSTQGGCSRQTDAWDPLPIAEEDWVKSIVDDDARVNNLFDNPPNDMPLDFMASSAGSSVSASVPEDAYKVAQLKHSIASLQQQLERDRQELQAFERIQKANAAKMQRTTVIDARASSKQYSKGVSLLKSKKVMFYWQQNHLTLPVASNLKRKVVDTSPSSLGVLPSEDRVEPTPKRKKRVEGKTLWSKRRLRKGRGRTCAFTRPTHVRQYSADTYKLHEVGDDNTVPESRSKMADWEKRVTQGQWDRLPTDCPRCRGQGGARHTWTQSCMEAQKIRTTLLKPHYRDQIKQEAKERAPQSRNITVKAKSTGKKKSKRTGPVVL